MADLSNFCNPSEEMDDIARKIRANEVDVNYQKLFQDQADVKANAVKPEQEMDAVAMSIRLQSECAMSVEDANAAAHAMYPTSCLPE